MMRSRVSFATGSTSSGPGAWPAAVLVALDMSRDRTPRGPGRDTQPPGDHAIGGALRLARRPGPGVGRRAQIPFSHDARAAACGGLWLLYELTMSFSGQHEPRPSDPSSPHASGKRASRRIPAPGTRAIAEE